MSICPAKDSTAAIIKGSIEFIFEYKVYRILLTEFNFISNQIAEYSNTEKKTYCGSTFALNNYSYKDISIKKKLFNYRQFRISKIILKQIR